VELSSEFHGSDTTCETIFMPALLSSTAPDGLAAKPSIAISTIRWQGINSKTPSLPRASSRCVGFRWTTLTSGSTRIREGNVDGLPDESEEPSLIPCCAAHCPAQGLPHQSPKALVTCRRPGAPGRVKRPSGVMIPPAVAIRWCSD